MVTFVSWYLLIGSCMYLLSNADLNFKELIAFIILWPLVMIAAVIELTKGVK